MVISDPAEMKPGDLVFVSGTYMYLNEERKQQRHNMVHVEIWLGEEDKTVGARWQKGRYYLIHMVLLYTHTHTHTHTHIFCIFY